MKRTLLTLMAALAIALAGVGGVSAKQDMFTICHATSSETNPFVTLTIAAPAVYGPAGHFNENGTTQAGHEEDYFGPCVTPSATPEPSSEASPTPSPTFSPSPSTQPTPSPLPSSTASPSPTPTPRSNGTPIPTASPTPPAPTASVSGSTGSALPTQAPTPALPETDTAPTAADWALAGAILWFALSVLVVLTVCGSGRRA